MRAHTSAEPPARNIPGCMLHRSRPVATTSSPGATWHGGAGCGFVCCRAVPVRCGQHCRSGRAAVGTRYAASTPRGTAAADLAAQSSPASTPARASAARGWVRRTAPQCDRTARRSCAPPGPRWYPEYSHGYSEYSQCGRTARRSCAPPADCVARRVVGCACVAARMLQAGLDPPITSSKHRPVCA
jgi:hypothetical protein